MKVALFHFADVNNFGDILFPYLAARELRSRLPGVEIDFLCPTGESLPGLPSTRPGDRPLDGYDALILAGGEVVHRYDRGLTEIYTRLGRTAIDRPTDVVFGWTDVEGPYKAWLGVGVPKLTAEARLSIARALPHLDLAAGRGSVSEARLLECGGEPGRVRRVADLGWLFPRLLAGTTPTSQGPTPAAGGRAYLVFNSYATFAGNGEMPKVRSALRRIRQAYDLDIVLLPLMLCFGDGEGLGELACSAGDDFLLVDPDLDVLEKLRILANSVLYVGQSMHGLISAMAHARPGGICFPRGDNKFREFFDDLHITRSQIDDWSGLSGLVSDLLATPVCRVLSPRHEAIAQADRLFDDVAEGIRRHVARR